MHKSLHPNMPSNLTLGTAPGRQTQLITANTSLHLEETNTPFHLQLFGFSAVSAMDRQQTEQINNLVSIGFFDAQHLQLLQVGGTSYFDAKPKSDAISSLETAYTAQGHNWLLNANLQAELGSAGEEMMCKGTMDTWPRKAAQELPVHEYSLGSNININIEEATMKIENYRGLISTQRSNISDFLSSANGALSASNCSSPLSLLHGAQSSAGAHRFDDIAWRNPNLPLAAPYACWGNGDHNKAEPNISWNQQHGPSFTPAASCRSTLLINNQPIHDFPTSYSQSKSLSLINTSGAPGAADEQMQQNIKFCTLDYSYSDTGNAASSSVGVLRRSKYLRAAQQLLDEVCKVKACTSRGEGATHSKTSTASDDPLHDQFMKAGPANTCRSKEQRMSGEERYSLHMKKARLIAMVEQLDQRYQQYQEEMDLIVTSFESATGMGAAAPYTVLAKKLISRKFRALRDAIGEHIHAACRMLGDDISSVPILNKGETPRLRILDQRMRHHRTLQQVGMLSQLHQGWRPQRGLPERCVAVLRAWLFEHFLHPYPKDSEKLMLARLTGLTRNQVANWFINARVRLWKPMVEQMYAEERKEAEYQNQARAEAYIEETSITEYEPSAGFKGKNVYMELAGEEGNENTRITENPTNRHYYQHLEHEECNSRTLHRPRSVMTKHGVSLTLALHEHSSSVELEPSTYKPYNHYNLLHPVSGDADYNITDAFC